MGYALSFDHDLDMFVASLGLVKTSIEAAMKEDGKLSLQVRRVLVLTTPSFTRRGFGYGRLRPHRDFIRSSEEGSGPVQEREEPIEVRF